MLILFLLSATGFSLIPPVCSIGVNPFSPGAPDTFFWAVFSSEMVRASFGTHPPEVVPEQPQELLPGHWSRPDITGGLYGQVVHIGEVAGHRSKELASQAKGGRSNRAVVVLWDYDAGCDLTPFGDGAPWGVVGDTAYFVARLRDRAEWADDLPTFDAYWGGEMIYPFAATKHGREFQEYMRASRAEPQSPIQEERELTARQAFQLVRALPSACDYVKGRFWARLRLRWHMWKWAEFRDYYPADRIFRNHERLRDEENPGLKQRCE